MGPNEEEEESESVRDFWKNIKSIPSGRLWNQNLEC
jgi:hypothetical protein